MGSNPVKSDGVLRVIKVCGTTSFGGEIEPSVPCHNTLRHVTDPLK
jgi:hypothetical protein